LSCFVVVVFFADATVLEHVQWQQNLIKHDICKLACPNELNETKMKFEGGGGGGDQKKKGGGGR